MERPRVLVLLASYNGAPYIVEQVGSILAQSYVDVTIDIGDDRSKDGTCEALIAAFSADARVRVTRWESASGSAGANFRRLIARATVDDVDWVAFSDQDDRWFADKLRRAVDALARSSALGYSSAVEAFGADGKTRLLQQCRLERDADFLFEGAGQGCTFVLRRSFFLHVQAVLSRCEAETATMYFHDWMVYLMARTLAADAWLFDPVPSMAYRQHEGNEIGARGGLASVTRRLAQVRNGWYRHQVAAALALHRAMDGATPAVHRFGELFERGPSAGRRLALLAFVVRHGRRRALDRAVLALAALAGWL